MQNDNAIGWQKRREELKRTCREKKSGNWRRMNPRCKIYIKESLKEKEIDAENDEITLALNQEKIMP